MISLSHTRYGSACAPGRARPGREPRCTSYQSSSAVAADCVFKERCCAIAIVTDSLPIMARDAKHDTPEPPPRRNRAEPVARNAAALSQDVFARAGFRDPTLVLHWVT